ncbi:serine/threonine-protein kinase [Rhodococcus erythropolis]|uniref:Protein kinase domain-containing protein n=1 Tax=Rhodococcus erythropolis TaxID=1833 RepID=A0A8I0ZTP4_RHOER|nr:serine/threonine-protein kinase [Rhodococcus erythropolis]MBH5141117.1 hypothetical protein [Rhodococcus erythropolis]
MIQFGIESETGESQLGYVGWRYPSRPHDVSMLIEPMRPRVLDNNTDPTAIQAALNIQTGPWLCFADQELSEPLEMVAKVFRMSPLPPDIDGSIARRQSMFERELGVLRRIHDLDMSLFHDRYVAESQSLASQVVVPLIDDGTFKIPNGTDTDGQDSFVTGKYLVLAKGAGPVPAHRTAAAQPDLRERLSLSTMDAFLRLFEFAHALPDEAFIHGDVKPENLVLAPGSARDKIEGDNTILPRLWIIDFGHSGHIEGNEGFLPLTDAIPNPRPFEATLFYRLDNAGIGKRTAVVDLFALAVTTYQIFTGGLLPFEWSREVAGPWRPTAADDADFHLLISRIGSIAQAAFAGHLRFTWTEGMNHVGGHVVPRPLRTLWDRMLKSIPETYHPNSDATGKDSTSFPQTLRVEFDQYTLDKNYHYAPLPDHTTGTAQRPPISDAATRGQPATEKLKPPAISSTTQSSESTTSSLNALFGPRFPKQRTPPAEMAPARPSRTRLKKESADAYRKYLDRHQERLGPEESSNTHDGQNNSFGNEPQTLNESLIIKKNHSDSISKDNYSPGKSDAEKELDEPEFGISDYELDKLIHGDLAEGITRYRSDRSFSDSAVVTADDHQGEEKRDSLLNLAESGESNSTADGDIAEKADVNNSWTLTDTFLLVLSFIAVIGGVFLIFVLSVAFMGFFDRYVREIPGVSMGSFSFVQIPWTMEAGTIIGMVSAIYIGISRFDAISSLDRLNPPPKMPRWFKVVMTATMLLLVLAGPWTALAGRQLLQWHQGFPIEQWGTLEHSVSVATSILGGALMLALYKVVEYFAYHPITDTHRDGRRKLIEKIANRSLRMFTAFLIVAVVMAAVSAFLVLQRTIPSSADALKDAAPLSCANPYTTTVPSARWCLDNAADWTPLQPTPDQLSIHPTPLIPLILTAPCEVGSDRVEIFGGTADAVGAATPETKPKPTSQRIRAGAGIEFAVSESRPNANGTSTTVYTTVGSGSGQSTAFTIIRTSDCAQSVPDTSFENLLLGLDARGPVCMDYMYFDHPAGIDAEIFQQISEAGLCIPANGEWKPVDPRSEGFQDASDTAWGDKAWRRMGIARIHYNETFINMVIYFYETGQSSAMSEVVPGVFEYGNDEGNFRKLQRNLSTERGVLRISAEVFEEFSDGWSSPSDENILKSAEILAAVTVDSH